MKNQGAENQAIGKVLRKMRDRHDILHKSATNAKVLINLLNVQPFERLPFDYSRSVLEGILRSQQP